MTAALRPLATLAALIVVSACNNSGPVPNYASLDRRYDSLAEAVSPLSFTPAANVPTSGRASYKGVFSGSVVEQNNNGDLASERIAGDARLTFRFGADRMDGRISGLAGETMGPIYGDITITGTGKTTGLSGVPVFDGTYAGDLELQTPDGDPRSGVAVLGTANGSLVQGNGSKAIVFLTPGGGSADPRITGLILARQQ